MTDTPNSEDLASYFEQYNTAWSDLNQLQRQLFMPGDLKSYRIFRDCHIRDGFLSGASFELYKFINCRFEDTQLKDCYFYACEFTYCTFQKSELSTLKFVEVLFEDCFFEGGLFQQNEFSDVHFERTAFAGFRDMIEVRFGGCSYANLQFVRCGLSYLRFENQVLPEHRSIGFLWCDLAHCFFYWVRFDHISFDECTIGLSNFSNCEIFENSIALTNITRDDEYNSVDFQTILKSKIPAGVLERQFGIFNSDLKSYVMDMVRKVELHTVFISYSFSDKTFAHRLNEALRARGVMTFLWEKDAPAGERLRKIMSHNIQKFDKLLFVASAHSLKSEACHFELSNGRAIQDKNWDLVLFPIHIDDFLFTVREEDIPRTKRTEVWKNIEELREIHSMDLSAYSAVTYDQVAFDAQVDKLVRGLRKHKDPKH